MAKSKAGFQKALQRAMSLHQAENLVAAKAAYRNLYKSHPEHPDVLHFYGMYLFQHENQKAGMRLVRKCLEIKSDYPDALNNLGNMCKLTGALDEAASLYTRVIDLHPGFYDAMVNLGVLARTRQDYELAEHWYGEAIATDPHKVIAYDNLSRLLSKLGRITEALRVTDQVARLTLVEDGLNEAMHALRGRLMLLLDDREGAVEAYENWLQAYPDSHYARHMLAAASGDNAPPKSDPAFVKGLFDGFAESFDEVLDQLDYAAPALVGKQVEHLCARDHSALAVLDAGCGTGLCGSFLKPFSRTLTGVDISSGMLSRASATSHYDELIEADIVEFFNRQSHVYDLIVSADTLNYFGDLQELFVAAHDAMKPSAYYVFTLEQHEDDNKSDYVLNAHGRYSHSHAYLQRVMDSAKLSIVSNQTVVLRKELGRDVNGFLITVRA